VFANKAITEVGYCMLKSTWPSIYFNTCSCCCRSGDDRHTWKTYSSFSLCHIYFPWKSWIAVSNRNTQIHT